MKKVTFIVSLIVVIVVAVLLIVPLADKEKETNDNTVRIGYQAHVGHLPLFVAIEKGFFESNGVKIEPIEFKSANLLLNGMLAGEVEGSAVSSFHALFSLEQRSPGLFKIYAIEVWTKDRLTHAFLVRQISNITTLGDLRGKTLGVHPGTTTRTYAKLILDRFFDANNNLRIIELNPALQAQSLSTGHVDALLIMEPMVSQAAIKTNAHILLANPYNDYLFDPFPIAGSVLSSRFINEHPDLAQSIVFAFYDAVKYIRNSDTRQEIESILQKYTPIDKEIASKIDFRKYWINDEIDIGAIQEIADFLYSNRLLDSPINTQNLFIDF